METPLQSPDFREYRSIIQSLIETESPRIVPNSSSFHAAVIVEEMILHSKRSFFAISQRLDPSVWSQGVVQALEAALRRAVEVRLLVEEKISDRLGQWPEALRERIRTVAPDSGADVPNFAVMDGRALRLEMDKDACHAAFCAGNAELAALALDRFDSLWNGSSSAK